MKDVIRYNGDGRNMVGTIALVPMLVDGDERVSFCTLAPLDDRGTAELWR